MPRDEPSTAVESEHQIPAAEALVAGATDLLRRHFAALNSGDRESFRDTAMITAANDGLPFERWWDAMRSMAPLDVQFTPKSVGSRDPVRGTHPSAPNHVAVWVAVTAHSAATGRTYSEDFVVWLLLDTQEWKLGCRVHWWLRS